MRIRNCSKALIGAVVFGSLLSAQSSAEKLFQPPVQTVQFVNDFEYSDVDTRELEKIADQIYEKYASQIAEMNIPESFLDATLLIDVPGRRLEWITLRQFLTLMINRVEVLGTMDRVIIHGVAHDDAYGFLQEAIGVGSFGVLFAPKGRHLVPVYQVDNGNQKPIRTPSEKGKLGMTLIRFANPND